MALCARRCRRNFADLVEPDRPNETDGIWQDRRARWPFRAEIAALATEWLEADISGARKQLRSQACLPISI